MKDENKTKAQLIAELTEMRRHVNDLEDLLKNTTQTYKSMQEDMQRFQELADMFPQVIYETNEQGDLTFVNAQGFKLFGYTKEDFEKGLTAFEMLAPEERERAAFNFRKIINEGQIGSSNEYQALKKTGGTFPVIVYSSPVFRENKVFGLRGILIDDSERKLAEEELRKFQTISARANFGVALADLDGNIQYLNDAFAQMHQYKVKELIGKHLSIFHNEEQMPKVNELYHELMQVGSFSAKEVWHTRKDGSVFPTLMNANVIVEEDIPRYLSATAIDISDLKQAEEEKDRLGSQLRQAQKLETIGTLAGGIAHDFNNILAPIVIYTEMVLSSMPSSNPLSEDLKQILNGTNRAKELIGQILTFSRQMEHERIPLSLHIIINEALNLLRPSIPTTVEIRQRIDASCRNIVADPSQMHQVIVNLCTNSFYAMEDKGGVLTIELKEVEVDAKTAKLHPNLREKEYVRLTVSDTGIGMNNTDLDRIFEPFFTTKEVDKGTGLGLSVVHGIVQSHDGEIIVNSEVGKGTTFQVFFPVLMSEMEDEIIDLESIQGGRESILIIDDEKSIATAMKKMLKQLGYQVAVKNNSIEALKSFRQQYNHYDLVITDLTMQYMTGLDLIKELQKIRPELPIILITGYGEEVTKDILNFQGIHEIIGKPFSSSEMASVIRKVLDK